MAFFCNRMNGWIRQLKRYFTTVLQPIISKIRNPAIPPPSHPQLLHDLCSANDQFRPILPLLEEKDDKTTNGEHAQAFSILDSSNDTDATKSISTLSLLSGGSAGQDEKCQLLSGKDIVQLLNAQVKSIDAKIQTLQKSYPPTSTEAELFFHSRCHRVSRISMPLDTWKRCSRTNSQPLLASE